MQNASILTVSIFVGCNCPACVILFTRDDLALMLALVNVTEIMYDLLLQQNVKWNCWSDLTLEIPSVTCVIRTHGLVADKCIFSGPLD